MKKFIKTSIAITLAFICLLGLTACKNTAVNEDGLWSDALYTEDTTLGEGKTTTTVEVKAGDKSVIFTINTDQEMLGAALLENKLVEGTDGLYTKVNGITADFNKDQAYWGFFVNGEYADKGIDDTKIEKDVKYKLEYTK